MFLPPLAPIPPSSIRLSIAPEEWEACLESWLTLSGLYTRLPPKELSSIASTPESTLVEYLRSFYYQKARTEHGDVSLSSQTTQKLQKGCFLLVHRVLESPKPPARLIEFEFLAELCHVHTKSASLSRLLARLWKSQAYALQSSLQKRKTTILKLDLPSQEAAQNNLRALADIMRVSPDAAILFMTGSDFLDALATQYSKSSSLEDRKAIVATTYLGLTSLVKSDSPNISLLSDHLYSLKAQADKSGAQSSVLADLVTNTPMTTKLRLIRSGTAERLSKLLDSLETYRSPSIARPRKHVRRKSPSGKGRVSHVNGEMHMHRMSLVTQVQDLFQDLGSGFILLLLDEFEDDVEQVTAHLLDDSLPLHLRDLDRSEQAPVFDNTQQAQLEHLAPRSTPPPSKRFVPDRRNVFDDDELDRLEVETSKLRMGKNKVDANSNNQPNKAAILSALAAFDSDDDERDDTYDVEDVGGTVDSAHPDGEPGPSAKVTQEENDMALFTAYKANPDLFGRTFNIRRGQARQTLKAETGMTNEAIEGWAIMLQREPERAQKLEAQATDFAGKQTVLGRTAYRESPGGTETEDSDAPAPGWSARGGGRGRGRGGRGRAGNVAGSSSDPNTAAAQRRKEANKGSRANHNRRDQRARKMARGGFPG